MRSGSSLASCTKQIEAVRAFEHPKYANRLVLVDTPGFVDTHRSISDWLKKTYFSLSSFLFLCCILFIIYRYKKGIKLAGIVYLHKITDNRMAGAPTHVCLVMW